MTVLLLDNHDSFTWNLAQCMQGLGATIDVVENDSSTPEALAARGYDALVVSPGPGRPENAGIAVALIRAMAGVVPVLGVCLGHQAIAHLYGGTVTRARELRHGKTSSVHHDGRTIFSGLPNPFPAMRYHSLALDPETVPEALEVSARSDDGTIMGLRHRSDLVEGVQFHPESILTPDGTRLLANFLHLAASAGKIAARRSAAP